MKKGVQSFLTILPHTIALSGRTVFTGTLVLIFFSVVLSFVRKAISRSLEIESNGNQNIKHRNSSVTIALKCDAFAVL